MTTWPVLAVVAATIVGLQAPSPTLTVTDPEPGSYVSGPVLIRARVMPPGTKVAQLIVFVDGAVACRVAAPPWECLWDAGDFVKEHTVRVVAELPDERRLTETVRTRGTAHVERVDVEAIQVTVTVTGDDDQPVRALPREAFRVREDGVQQRITSFASENIPLEIVMALDVSGSMGEAIPALQDAARGFLAALKPNDIVTLLAFNDNIFTLVKRSTNRADRLLAVDRLASWGGTALYDVILKATALVGGQPGRRVLVVFSDGDDRSSLATLADVERRMERSDMTVYTVALGRAIQDQKLGGILRKLARASGGRAFAAEDAGKLDETFGSIMEELASQYLLAYVSSNDRRDGTWRKISVEVTGSHRVRAREGYRAAGP